MKENAHDINPHYDHTPKDQEMLKFGWRRDKDGHWAMPADEYIWKLEQQQIAELDNRFMLDSLDSALKDCLQIDKEVDHGREAA